MKRVFLIILIGITLPCVITYSKNPFDKTRPIGIRRFYEPKLDQIESKVGDADGGEIFKKIKNGNLRAAIDQLRNAKMEIDNIRSGEDSYIKTRKDQLLKKCESAAILCVIESYFSDKIDNREIKSFVREFFGDLTGASDQVFIENYLKKLDENDLRDLLFNNFSGDPDQTKYKQGYIYRVREEYDKAISELESIENEISSLPSVPEGIGSLNKQLALSYIGKTHSDLEDAEIEKLLECQKNVEKLNIAEEIDPRFKEIQDTLMEQITEKLTQTLEDQVFVDEQNYLKYWDSIWEIFDPSLEIKELIKSGVILEKDCELIKSIKERSDTLADFKIGWFYGALGDYELAEEYLKTAYDNSDGSHKVLTGYFYGQILEAKSRIFGADGAFHIYNSILATKPNNEPYGAIIRGRIAAFRSLQDLTKETPMDELIRAYQLALRVSPDCFYIRKVLIDLLKEEWVGSGFDYWSDLPGNEGFYHATLPRQQDISLFFSLMQVFYGPNKLEIVEPDQNKIEIKLLNEPVSLINYPLLSPPEIEAIYNSFRIERIADIMAKIADCMGKADTTFFDSVPVEELPATLEDCHIKWLESPKYPWTAVEVYYLQGRLYEEKGVLPLAAEFYRRSMEIIPTAAAFDRRTKVLDELPDEISQRYSAQIETAPNVIQIEKPSFQCFKSVVSIGQ